MPLNKSKGKDESPVRMKPMIHLSEDELKAVKKWTVGKKYKLAVDVQQTSQSIGENKKTSAGFDILKVTPREARLHSVKDRSNKYS